MSLPRVFRASPGAGCTATPKKGQPTIIIKIQHTRPLMHMCRFIAAEGSATTAGDLSPVVALRAGRTSAANSTNIPRLGTASIQ